MNLTVEVSGFFSLPFLFFVAERKFDKGAKKVNVCQAFFSLLPLLWSHLLVLCFSLQLQKRKEREEQLEDVIQAYEKIHMEKSNLQRDLDKMVRGNIRFITPSISHFTLALHVSHMAY